mgnify:CR=1 FL=1
MRNQNKNKVKNIMSAVSIKLAGKIKQNKKTKKKKK